MVNIVVALKIWVTQWSNKTLRIKCDNMAVVLTSGRTKDNILATFARNVWLLSAMFNISTHIEHILGKQNVVADLLSRYQFDEKSWNMLRSHVPEVIWITCCTLFDLLLKEPTAECFKISWPSWWSLGCPWAR